MYKWNSYIKQNVGSLIEVARSCGYKIIGTPIADIDEDADLINIAMGMRYKREAEKSIFEARDMIMELLPDCRFYLYAEGVEYIKNNMPVIYDGVLRI